MKQRKEQIMKRLLSVVFAAGLLLVPFATNVQAAQSSGATPPVAQVLVREGDFAISLAETLGLGTADSEAEAENIMASAGIMPKNGWVADYPVTPDIVGELQDSVATAADAGQLAMTRPEAVKSFQTLTADYGLAVTRDTQRANGEDLAPDESGQYTDATVVNNYYYEDGPPVVTYYPPPWDYYYMYSWVPYPFRCAGFAFSGFFVLNDFDRFDHVVIINKHGHHKHMRSGHGGGAVKLVSNHVVDRSAHGVAVIDPVLRGTGNDMMVGANSMAHRSVSSKGARGGAASITEGGLERGRIRGDGVATNVPSGFAGRGSERMTNRAAGQHMESNSAEMPRQDLNSGSVNAPRGPDRQGQMSVERSFGGGDRSFNVPHEGGGGSSRSGSRGGGGFSMGCAGCHGGGGSHGGGGFHGGGGGSHGGGRGR
jgi:hypothetical protein